MTTKLTILLAALIGFAVYVSAAPAALAAPELGVGVDNTPSFAGPGATDTIVVVARNDGDVPTTDPVTVEVTLPAEMTATAVTDGFATSPAGELFGPAWSCAISPDPHSVSCTLPPGAPLGFGEILPGGEACSNLGVLFRCPIMITADVASTATGTGTAQAQACGGGAAACAAALHSFRFRPGGYGLIRWDSDWTVDQDGNEFTQAGGHPYSVINSFDLARGADGAPEGGRLRNAIAQLPPGFIGAPNVSPTCVGVEDLLSSPSEFGSLRPASQCPLNAIVGAIDVRTPDGVNSAPIFNMKPPPGVPAQFGFQIFNFPVLLNATLRSNGDYGININSTNISQGLTVLGVTTTFWGVPADPSHDIQRCAVYENGGVSAEGDNTCKGEPGTRRGPNSASVGTAKPFLTNPTECTPDGVGKPIPFHVDSWAQPTSSDDLTMITHKAGDPSHQIGNTGCDVVPFEPKIAVQPTTDKADSPTGLEVTITVPTDGINNTDGIAQSSLEDSTVELPEGMTLNPSYGDGVAVCTSDQIGLTTGDAPEIHFNEEPSHCPDAAEIGTVHIETPLLDFPLDGGVYLAEQEDPAKPGVENPFDGLLALYIVAEAPGHGIAIKLAGKVSLDPDTSQVVTTFENNPQIAFSKFVLKFKGGQRAPLATPSTCGTFPTVGRFTPYARPTEPEVVSDTLEINKGPDGTAASCVSGPQDRPFHPGFRAGTQDFQAGAFSPFAMRILRSDGEQEITSISADLPPGLSGSLAGLAKCSDAAIAAAKGKSGRQEKANPSCPAASQVGTTLVGAGTGSILTYSPGKVYLAGPYKGTPLSVVSITPATVGPFDLGTVAIRSALKIDDDDAQVHVDARASDPIPHILKGIAVHIRDIRVVLDRPHFTLNPTNCNRMAIAATLTGTGASFANSADDIPVGVSNPFQVANCAALDFKPKLTFKLKGGTHRGDFPALEANLVARPGDANIAGSTVVLPRSEFIEQGHIRTVCTRVQFAKDQCPAGSIYGFAKATTPLLDDPVEGPVYLRSNGGERVLPDLVASLNGEINVALVGFIDSVKGRVRNTFSVIPDAPVTKFRLNMRGGRKGLLVNHLDLCTVTSRADVKLVGQNGKVSQTKPKMGTSCKAKGRKKHKRQR